MISLMVENSETKIMDIDNTTMKKEKIRIRRSEFKK